MISIRSKRFKLTLEISEILLLYREGHSTTETEEKANDSRRYISQSLNENEVELRPRGSWKRKYHIIEKSLYNLVG
jgi:hypothetical protein